MRRTGNPCRVLAMVVSSFVGLMGCQGQDSDKNQRQSVPAPQFVSDAFLVTETTDGPNLATIAVRPAALEKEFLLQSGASLMPWVGSSQSNKSRIVAFKKRGEFLYMMEATQGHIVTDDIDQQLILTRFPIVTEGEEGITIDFNTGMNRLFLASEWRASDYEGSDVDRDTDGVAVRFSYLKAATIDIGRQQLVVSQVAQLDADTGEGSRDLGTVEMKYYLQPYAPTADFTPTESKGFTKRGFFEVAPQYVDGAAKVYASKFANKPLEFAVSPNTPEEYRQAVTDGILYWNKAFGEERVSAVVAPEGITAPDYNYNVVQWINWDTAGFAYADAQADPRTGEILHAQVYMTSVFAVAGRTRAERLLKQLEGETEDPSGFTVGLAGFEQGFLCVRNLTGQFKQALRKLLDEGATDERILKASQDYVREVIAHEVGHTLGLRHNFAGSLHANYAVSELEGHLRSYFENGRTPAGVEPSSSVMEYQLFEESILTGDTMTRAEDAPMDYDLQAIQYLYQGVEPEAGSEPLFCTDTANAEFVDCLVFDRGRSPFESYDSQLGILNDWLATTVDVDGTAVPQVYLLPTSTAVATILQPYVAIASALSEEAKVLAVRRTETSPIEDVIKAKEWDFLLADADNFEGLDRFLTLPRLPDAPTEEYLPAKAALERALAGGWLSQLAGFAAPGQKLPDHELGLAAGSTIAATLANYLTATTGVTDTIEWARENEPTRIVNLPEFVYGIDLRLQAATVLKSDLAADQSFGYLAALQAKAELDDIFAEAVGEGIADDDLTDAPAKISRFVIEQRKLRQRL